MIPAYIGLNNDLGRNTAIHYIDNNLSTTQDSNSS